MASYAEVITDSLRLLGILREDEQASPAQVAGGLVKMNDLLGEWLADGVDVGGFPQTDPSREFNSDYSVQAAVKYNLAIACAPDYGVQVTPEVSVPAGRFYSRLTRDAVRSALMVPASLVIPLGEAVGGTENILTGD